jgi:hypothetical protein
MLKIRFARRLSPALPSAGNVLLSGWMLLRFRRELLRRMSADEQ